MEARKIAYGGLRFYFDTPELIQGYKNYKKGGKFNKNTGNVISTPFIFFCRKKRICFLKDTFYPPLCTEPNRHTSTVKKAGPNPTEITTDFKCSGMNHFHLITNYFMLLNLFFPYINVFWNTYIFL